MRSRMFKYFIIFLLVFSAAADEVPPKPLLKTVLPSSPERVRLQVENNFKYDQNEIPELLAQQEIKMISLNVVKKANFKAVRLVLIPFKKNTLVNVHQDVSLPFVKYIIAFDESGQMYYFASQVKSDSLSYHKPFADFDFSFNVEGIEVTAQGLLKSKVQRDHLKLANEGFELQFSYRNGLKSKMLIQPDFFRNGLHLDFSARKAANGRNGARVFEPPAAAAGITTRGLNGKSGLSFDEPGAFGENGLPGGDAAAAGHGADGMDGADGKNGQEGAAGRDRGKIDLKIEEVQSAFSQDTLLMISGDNIRSLIIPASQKISILAKGEDGGNGGHGSNGAKGGQGGKGGNSIGGNGGHGGHGARGFDGADGFDATVLAPASSGLNGGHGGNGGHGAIGGNGGIAGNGGLGGKGGDGAHGGDGGPGGRGAEVTINLLGSKAFRKLLKDNLSVQVPGGKGGLGGNPGLGAFGGLGGLGGTSFGGLGGKRGLGGDGGNGGHGGDGIVWEEFTGFCSCSHHHRYKSRNCPQSHRLWQYTAYCNCTGKHSWGSHGCAQIDRKWSYGKYCSCGSTKHLWKPECKSGHREKVYSKHCHCKKRHKHGSGCPSGRQFREWKYTGFCDCNTHHRIVKGMCSKRFWLSITRQRPVASNGFDGRPGLDGFEGKRGLPGKNGLNGLPGKAGLPGNKGKNGQDGAEGLVKIIEKEK